MELLKNVEKLSQIPGVSGCEDLVREEILSQLQGLCQCTVDPLGNVIAFKKGAKSPEQPLMLCAHMDEVGFIVTRIEEGGLLRFATVGGIDSRVVPGKAVEVGERRVYGVVGSRATHLLKESEKEEAVPVDKLYIDIGARSADEAAELVQPGDRAVFHSVLRRVGKDRIMGRALDDRAGCAVLIDLAGRELPYDCYLVFTVQEEIGCVGAVTASYAVNPGAAIVVETTTASDIPGVEPHKVVCSFGKGPVLSFMDRGAIYDFDFHNRALETAREQGIPCQVKEGVFGGNDSRSVQVARQGVRTLAVSMPCRYLHTPSNMLKESDILDTARLLRALIPVAATL